MPSGTAPGFRDSGHHGRLGGLISVSNNGFSWSLATSSIDGLYLDFGMTALNPSNASSRAYGFQLRCLSE
ncbi:hypothetical protein [uncultured Rikenella sp.]|uniref:hypothetical protein n=1 Tax=uncultured Rikenella sp. TaxID=368003 RepID=UPI00272BEBBF|nr:hypothetical protein [uncultured Rikenella sp.]